MWQEPGFLLFFARGGAADASGAHISLPMPNLLNAGDVGDVLRKLRAKGVQTLAPGVRAKWNRETGGTANAWWAVPAVRRRWNRAISGEDTVSYPTHLGRLLHERFPGRVWQVLSPGFGSGNTERRLAALPAIASVTGVELSPQRVAAARRAATALPPPTQQKLQFRAGRFDGLAALPPGVNLVHFRQALHHFSAIDQLLAGLARQLQTSDGLLVLHEYVGPNRLQLPAARLKEMNRLLQTLPPEFRRRPNGQLKRRIYVPGRWRMQLVDPTEAPESAHILPALERYFRPVQQVWLGGDFLQLLLKDIAHQFTDEHPEALRLLQRLFRAEDDWITQHGRSDFVFGVYQPKEATPPGAGGAALTPPNP